MGFRRGGAKMARLWRSRRMVVRVALILLLLCFLSLFFMFWSFAVDTASTPQHRFFAPPPHYGDDYTEGGNTNDGKIPFRRGPHKVTTTRVPSTPEVFAPSSSMMWFGNENNKKTSTKVKDADLAPSTQRSVSEPSVAMHLFQSHGVARVVIPSGEEADVDDGTPQTPRLLAANMSWAFYNFYLKARPHERQTRGLAAEAGKRHVYALRQFEVQLWRQRTARNAWATAAGAEAMSPIVGFVPVESIILANADELLVEHHLRAEDQPNTEPDPLRFVELGAAFKRATDRHGAKSSLHIDGLQTIKDRLEAPTSTANTAVTTTPPLVEVKNTRRSASLFDEGAATRGHAEVISPAATFFTWRVGDAAASPQPLTLDLVLDKVVPRREKRGHAERRHDDGDDDDEVLGDVYAEALQATLCSAHFVRMYGLTPNPLQGHQTDPADGVEGLPLNMREGIEVKVGGPSSASPGTRHAGVVPLLYLELDDRAEATAAARRTVGLLWLHPAPFVVYTASTAAQTCVRLRSTAGATKLFLLPGPTPADVLRQYYTLTGFPTLPPRFILGYHHGLRGAAAATETAAEALSAAFLRSRVPLDSVWMTDGAVAARDTPFTWNTSRFPDAVRLQSNLWYGGRRYLVVRSVPTIPITGHNPLYLEGKRNHHFITLNAESGTGWPTYSLGEVPSHVVDFASAAARRWYGNMLKYRRFVGSTNHTFVNLQYAAPAVIADEGEVRAAARQSTCAVRQLQRMGSLVPMDVGHHGGFAHREVHQLLSVNFAKAAHEGMLRRAQYVRRALVLTNNFYAGIQRYAVVQVETQPGCGQAAAEATSSTRETSAVLDAAWTQLRSAVQQCARLSVLGVPFSGANLAAALTAELLTELQPRRVPSSPALTGGVDTDDAQEAVADNDVNEIDTAHTAGSARREAEELLVRWYQAGLFFAAMYAVEDATVSDAVVAENSAGEPWWMRLRVGGPAREALQTNLKVRYALLPYLYTAAYNVSEHGSSFFAPMSFAQRDALAVRDVRSAASPACYAVGTALITCPVTRSASAQKAAVETSALVKTAGGMGLFDLWTGVWKHPPKTFPTNTTLTAAAASRGAPLYWLTASGRGGSFAATPTAPVPNSASLAPAYIRPGHIIATQNVLTVDVPQSTVVSAGIDGAAGVASPATMADAHAMHSTHMGANWTLTIALPPLPRRLTSPRSKPQQQQQRVLLAEGDVYWDEGGHNTQQRPPARQPGATQLSLSFPFIPHHAPHCQLQLRCFYETSPHGSTAAQLVLEVAQTSDSCAEALAQLQSHWNEEPDGFAERLARAKERRDARRHAREVELNEKEDRGVRTRRGRDTAADAFLPEDLLGLRLPPPAEEETARNDVWRSHLLHRVRFLFQREEDASRLADMRAGGGAGVAGQAPLTVSVKRQSVMTATTATAAAAAAATAAETALPGHSPVSRSSPSAHEVLVDLSKDASAAAKNVGATPVFGMTKKVTKSGKVTLSIPTAHTWRFVFPLS